MVVEAVHMTKESQTGRASQLRVFRKRRIVVNWRREHLQLINFCVQITQ